MVGYCGIKKLWGILRYTQTENIHEISQPVGNSWCTAIAYTE